MRTREDINLMPSVFETRRERMIYITPPYTSLRDDAMLLSADAAVATQGYIARQESAIQNAKALEIPEPFTVPEKTTGHIFAHLA